MYGERLDCVIFMAVLFYPINFTIKNIKNQIFFKTFLFILLIFQKISIAIVNCMAWPIKNEVKKKLKNKYWAGQTKKKKKKEQEKHLFDATVSEKKSQKQYHRSRSPLFPMSLINIVTMEGDFIKENWNKCIHKSQKRTRWHIYKYYSREITFSPNVCIPEDK